jgi:hypothetical protein
VGEGGVTGGLMQWARLGSTGIGALIKIERAVDIRGKSIL